MRPLSKKMFRPLSCLVVASALLVSGLAYAGDFQGVLDVRVAEGKNQLGLVTIELEGKPDYSARLDKARRRLIIDIQGAALKGAPEAITEGAGVVAGVMAQTFRGASGRTARISITLSEDASYAIVAKEGLLTVRFERGPLGALSGIAAREARAQEGDSSAAVALISVADVSFERDAFRDLVQIDLDGRARFRQDNGTNGRSTLIIRNARLPETLARKLDVAALGGDVHSVTSYARGRDVIVEVVRDTSVTSSVERHGNRLVWAFYEPGSLPSSVTGLGRDGQAARKSKTIYVEEQEAPLPEINSGNELLLDVTESEAEEAGAFSPATLGQARGYTGRRIDLDLKDADIHNVLRLIGDVSRRNIVVADDVSGSVTIRLRNVPWDQALAVILQSKKLGMVEQGNMIRVAPLDQLQRERELEMERRKMAVQLAPIETRLIPVSYAGANDLASRVQVLLSPRGSIAIDERTNTLIARDVSGALDQVEELARALDTQTPQVLVEARIVEATSRYIKDVGIQWGGSGTVSPTTGNPTGLVFPNSIGVAGGASDGQTPTAGLSPFASSVPTPNFAVNMPAAVGTGQGGALGLTFGSIDNNVNLAVRLSAAESSGMLRILSSPRILTLDNLEARISQGTLIPFSQVSAQGVQTTFQEAKLQLLVQPHVTADGSVQMRVKINRDEPDFNQTSARGEPTILKREAETELLVMDGHTAVIGGIFTRNTGRNLDQVPFFGDIPILGLLFQRRRASDTRGELVIFITPRIVNRAEALGR
jgi:type IV pilus assembly protein PilQ